VYDSAGLTLPYVLMSVSDYTRAFRPAGADMVFVNRAPGASVADSRAAVDAATASDPLLVVNTIAAYKATLASRVNQILTLFGALLGLAVLIALLGISNTPVPVGDRAHQGIRADARARPDPGPAAPDAADRGVADGGAGHRAGAGLGVTFGVVMVHAFVQSADGQGLLSIPYSHIALYAAIAVCAALAAAALPARRAARTSVVSAMAEA